MTHAIASCADFDEANFDELFRIIIDFADNVCFVEISMRPVQHAGHVHVHDVSALQLPHIWNAMADDFVHAGADALGKVMIS
jgi:hypothetical protein